VWFFNKLVTKSSIPLTVRLEKLKSNLVNAVLNSKKGKKRPAVKLWITLELEVNVLITSSFKEVFDFSSSANSQVHWKSRAAYAITTILIYLLLAYPMSYFLPKNH